MAHEGEVNAIRFSPQGKFLATAGADRKVKLWKEEGGKADLVGTLTGKSSSSVCECGRSEIIINSSTTVDILTLAMHWSQVSVRELFGAN